MTLKKIASLLISFMLLVNPFMGVMAEETPTDGQVIVKDENGEIAATFEAGETVSIVAGEDFDAGEYTVEGTDISVENKEGLVVDNSGSSEGELVVESDVNITATGYSGVGISAEGDSVVIEKGNVESEGTAVHAKDEASVVVEGTLSADTGVWAENGSFVLVDPDNKVEDDLEQIQAAETIDDLKALEAEGDVKAVEADLNGVMVHEGSKVIVAGDVVVDTEKSFGNGIVVGFDSKTDDESESSEKKSNTVLVAGDVTVQVESDVSDGWGVNIGNSDNDSTVVITGNVDVTTANSTIGIHASVSEETAEVYVEGGVTATAVSGGDGNNTAEVVGVNEYGSKKREQ